MAPATQVTSVFVSVEDGLKKAEEYAPPRKVRVELTASVGEGDDFGTIFDQVSLAASNRVHALLHGTALAVVQAAPETSANTSATTAPPADPSAIVDEEPAAGAPAEPEKPKRVRRTQAQIAADKAAAAGAPAGADPSAITDEDPTAGGEPVVHLPGPDADPSAIVDDDPTVVQPDPSAIVDAEFTIEPEAGEAITDADLNALVMAKNGELGSPNLIRELIKGYNPDPTKVFQLRDIPQEKRPEFVAKLKALVAPAA